MEAILEQTLHDGKLLRQVNALIVARLNDITESQAAAAVAASSTTTPPSEEAPLSNKLQLVSKGLAVARDGAAMLDSEAVPVRTSAMDFSAVRDTNGSSKSCRKHERHRVLEHKEISTPISSGKGKERLDQARAMWTDKLKKCFLDLCIEQANKSGRRGVNFNSGTWKTIMCKFREGTGYLYGQKQLKNQLDLMRRQYNAWVSLNRQPGIGRNEATQAVTMEPKRWVQFLKNHPGAKSFQYKPLQFVDEMEILFKDTSRRPRLEDTAHDDKAEDSISLEDTQSLYVPTPTQRDIVEEVESDEFIRVVRQKRAHPYECTRETKEAELDKRIDGLISLMEGEKSKEMHIVPSISECIASLRTIKEIPSTSALFMCAIRSFRDKECREIWTALPEEEARIAWLKDLHERGG